MRDPIIDPRRIGRNMTSLVLVATTLLSGGCARASSPATTRTEAPPSSTDRDVVFPSTPAGSAATEWLRAVNDGSPEETLAFYRDRYAKALLAQGSAEDRRDSTHELRMTEGRRHVRSIEASSETKIVALLQTELAETWQRLTIEVDPTPLHAIVKSAAEDIAPPNDPIPRDDQEATTVLDGYVTRMCDRGLFSGAVAVARRGAIVYERACGLASRAFGVANRVDT